MNIFAIRGAITVDADTPKQVTVRSVELMRTVAERNPVRPSDLRDHIHDGRHPFVLSRAGHPRIGSHGCTVVLLQRARDKGRAAAVHQSAGHGGQ